MKRRIAGLVVAVAMGAGPLSAEAATLVDTGPGEAFSGLILDGRPNGIGWTQSWHAGQFTLSQHSTISSLEVWMTVFGHPDVETDLTMSIYEANGMLPGSTPALKSLSVSLARSPDNFTPGWRGLNGLNWDLAAGSYWLALEPDSSSDFHGALWMQPANPLEHYAMNIRGEWEWDPQGQTGPDQWGLRILGTAGAVPEPATWAMMIIGFGTVGAAVRQRRRVAASRLVVD